MRRSQRETGSGAAGLAALCAATFLCAATTAWAGGDWNEAGVQWRPYEKGIAEAKKTGKPICLIFYTQWCPHCTNYSGVFHDAKVVEQTKKFVMIRIDNDKNQDLSARYAPDGGYIPRTLFLSSDGRLEANLDAGRASYRYFYDESDPASLLAGMDRALTRLGPKSGKPEAPASPARKAL